MEQPTVRSGTSHRRGHVRAAIAGIAALIITAIGLAPASASGSVWHNWEDSVYSEVAEDKCGVRGLTVQLDLVSDGKWRFVRAPNGLPLYKEVAQDTITYTNLANGAFVTQVEKRSLEHRRVTNNGDGTLTAIARLNAKFRVYASTGTVLDAFRTLGRLEVTIDHGGTPKNGADDEVIGVQFLDERSTGDLCDSMVPALT